MIATLLLAAPVQLPSAAPTGPPERQLLTWTPGPVMCDRVMVPAIVPRRPLGGLAWPGSHEGMGPVTYRFRIDAAGRPLSIARDGTGYAMQGEDIAPSLAASRFPAGIARDECAITYRATLSPMVTAPVADLNAYSVIPTGGPLPPAGWDRITPAGATCRTEPRPQPLRQVYPDFNKVPATPGVRSWSLVGYDLDPHGRPVDVHLVDGTRNVVLDAAAVAAIRASRYTHPGSPHARTGCRYPFWRAPATMAAPAPPASPASDRCPAGDTWASYPPLIYPEPWRRRGIEGWAVIGFDVAPWGELGNLRVIASEPAAEFGTEAMRMLRGARKPASATGASGCVDRVLFVMKPRIGQAQPPAPLHD